MGNENLVLAHMYDLVDSWLEEATRLRLEADTLESAAGDLIEALEAAELERLSAEQDAQDNRDALDSLYATQSTETGW